MVDVIVRYTGVSGEYTNFNLVEPIETEHL